MIAELRCVASADYVVPAVVAVHSFVRHNPWFSGPVSISCCEHEVQHVASLFEFLPMVVVTPIRASTVRAVEALQLEESWVPSRFFGLELLAQPAAGGDVLILDADTCTVGPMDAVAEVEGEIVACGEGATHRGWHVDRRTNAFDPGPLHEGLVDKTFNSGMMRIRGTVLGSAIFERAIDLLATTEWSGLQRPQHDQFILNRLFEGRWTELDPSHNYLLRHAAAIRDRHGLGVAQARLLHFNVDPRPWHLDQSARVTDPVVVAATRQWLCAHGAVLESRCLSRPGAPQ